MPIVNNILINTYFGKQYIYTYKPEMDNIKDREKEFY